MLNSIKKYLERLKERRLKEQQAEDTASIANQGIDTGRQPRLWTGIDLDRTLAYHNRSDSYKKVGPPVPEMMALVRKMINNGVRVKIFTARASDPRQLPIIRKWMQDNGLPDLEITNVKDYSMHRLYDDRCIQVEHNTGRLIVDR